MPVKEYPEKDESKRGLLFKSQDIKIIMQENLCPGKISKSNMIENPLSFNLLFMLSPDIHLEAQDDNIQFSFKKNQYILYHSPLGNKAELWSESQELLKYLQIQLSYQYVFKLINPESNRESTEILEKMTKNNYMFLHKETPPYMTAEMHMILKEMTSSSKKGVMQKLFIEAKIIKLLILIFEQFSEKDITASSPQLPLLIKKYIDENYHRKIMVEEIGKMIGVNQNIIRKEFKTQYHITVNHYISELRMLKAKKLIVDKEVMIKEIAIECGYEYVQNFTRAFKKKFGISPEKLRNE